MSAKLRDRDDYVNAVVGGMLAGSIFGYKSKWCVFCVHNRFNNIIHICTHTHTRTHTHAHTHTHSSQCGCRVENGHRTGGITGSGQVSHRQLSPSSCTSRREL